MSHHYAEHEKLLYSATNNAHGLMKAGEYDAAATTLRVALERYEELSDDD